MKFKIRILKTLYQHNSKIEAALTVVLNDVQEQKLLKKFQILITRFQYCVLSLFQRNERIYKNMVFFLPIAKV